MSHHHERFLGKAETYSAGRPSYPPEVLNRILTQTNLPCDATIYDLGAGTGIFTQLLLNHFNHVHLVEPNPDMRSVAVRELPLDKITVREQSAESFSAPPHSIDLITAAQAFHWFDQPTAKAHWKTVLKPNAHIALVWNENHPVNHFATDLVNLLTELNEQIPNLTQPKNARVGVSEFLNQMDSYSFEHSKSLSLPELSGLILSRSYSPLPTDPNYQKLTERINDLFHKHKVNNLVQLPIQTNLFIGRL